MLEGHISKAFDGALAALHLRVLAMGGLVLDQVREALKAYAQWDIATAEHVLERAAAVRAYNTGIYEDQFTLIARRQPVASDLRAIIALAKSGAELERAGAKACKIARTVLQSERPTRTTASDVRHLGDLALQLLRAALEALDRLDGTQAAALIARDEDLDAEYAAGLRRLVSRALEDPRQLERAVDTAFALKSLERIGDHARNIALQTQIIVSRAEPESQLRAPDPPLPEHPPEAFGPGPETGDSPAPR